MIPRIINNVPATAQSANATLELGTILRDTISCVIREERNGAYELTLTYPMGGYGLDLFEPNKVIVARINDEGDTDMFRIYSVVSQSEGIVTVSARHISYDLSGVFQANLDLGLRTAQSAIDRLVSPYGFAGESDITGTKSMAIGQPTSVRALLGGVEGSVLDTYGGEYKFYRRTVNLLSARGQDNGVVVSYGKNITSIQTEVNGEGTFNRLLPYATYFGDDGEVCVVGDAIIATNSPVIDPDVKTLAKDFSDEFDGEVVTKAQVNTVANQWYAANQKKFMEYAVSNDVSFIPIWYTGYTATSGNYISEKVSLCDIVTVRYEPLNVEYKAKVVETEYDCLEERFTSVTVGDTTTNFITSYYDEMSGSESTLSAVTRYPGRWKRDINNAVSNLAPLASPAFTGNPTAPTQAASSNNTRIATTAFVKTAISTIGSRVAGNGSSVTLATGTTAADLVTFDLDVGVWMVVITARFAENATGARMVRLSDATGGSALSHSLTTLVAPAPDGRTYIHAMGVVNVTTAKTYYVVAYQTSGGNLSALGRYDCVRII